VIVTMPVFDEVQVTEPVRSRVDPSLNVPVAVNCVVTPFAMLKFAVVTERDCRVGAPVPEEEQLPRTKIAQTQKMGRHNLLVDTKRTPHL